MFTMMSRPRGLAVYFGMVLVWFATTAMHIPDGYLSPSTSLVMLLLVLPFWAIGVRKIRRTMTAQSVPLIALMAAFSFVIMMFNVPLPGGTTGHAVGAALAAIVIGPEAATIAVSIALIIQALFFGDGGVLAIGANCFNMAVVIPYIASATYHAIARTSPYGSIRQWVGAVLGGWLGVTAAAFLAGVEFGIQPLLFTNASGTPLYAPYPLPISIPAMVIPHALIASVVEGIITALVLIYMQKSHPSLLPSARAASGVPAAAAWGTRWLWLGLAVLVLAAPLGLLAPGTAWGEWSTEELHRMGLAAVPAGLERLSGLWGAPMAGYEVHALGNASLGYLLSAGVGVAVVGLIVWLFVSLLVAGSSAGGEHHSR
jgi:cobalt/nickel transport system permease protein